MTIDLTPHGSLGSASTTSAHAAHSADGDAAAADAGTLVDIFADAVARWGERPALDAPEASLTYVGLNAAVRSVSDSLRAGGIGRGDRVGVRIESGTCDLYVAILAILHAGAAYVPVDADDPAPRAEQIFAEAKVCAVVGAGHEIKWRAPSGGLTGPPGPGDDAWVIFTSGSTGAPKGVAVTHSAAAAFVDAESRLWEVTPQDRVLAGLSVGFDASCEEMWLAWAHGAALVPAPRRLVRSGPELGPWLREQRITVVSTVPTLASIWDEGSLRGVRLLILGGEPCPEPLAWRLSRGREVWNTYGPTEATVVSTAARLQPGEPVTIGSPLHGWRVAVLDASGEPVAADEAGELVISGVGLGRYLDEVLDRGRFGPVESLGWERAYRTGDFVRQTAAGLQFVGRGDDQVKIGGRRIELGEIDGQLGAVPGIHAACTVVRETAAGNRLLVGYVSGNVDASTVRSHLEDRMPEGLVPTIVVLDELPMAISGKVNRTALPWPPPEQGPRLDRGGGLTDTERWLSTHWQEQLGPVSIGPSSDFFVLGGSSLAAAKLVSVLRARCPALAVADVYDHRRLSELAAHIDRLSSGSDEAAPAAAAGSPRWGMAQLFGLFGLLVIEAPQWLIGLLALDRFFPGQTGPRVGWGWLVVAWLLLCSAPGGALLVAGLQRMLLPATPPGRHPRNGWLSCRLWFIERVAALSRLESLAGTPWAVRYARLSGHSVGRGARLGTLPPIGSLVSIGAGATIEGDVDMHGWWIDGAQLVAGEIRVGPGARVGTRALLMPGAMVGEGAEVEPGSVVSGVVPAGERWAGSPARRVGRAGECWPAAPAPPARNAGLWKAMYGVGLLASNALALLAAVPGIALMLIAGSSDITTFAHAEHLLVLAPAFAALFTLAYATIVALVVRALAPLIKPGLHAGPGAAGWALWFTESLMSSARDVLFPLYASVYTRSWLRLAGVPVGRRSEISTAVGTTHLTSFAAGSFAADDVVLATGRSREGWLCIEPIAIGQRAFLGNGAILPGGGEIGDDSLIGLLTVAPDNTPEATSWLGSPALELPRRRRCDDPSLTTDPSRGRFLARAVTELVRILLPATASVVLGLMLLDALAAIGVHHGLAIMILSAPFLILAAGLAAVAFTIVVKWTVIGRYRAGDHPLWSFFVWRDEIVNSCQESLAGAWLLNTALGTPLMRVYLRLMGARIGRDVWCETLTITEFDLAELGDGVVVNRNAVVETHLFHDRVMQIGPAKLGAGSTLGPSTAMLPDSELGARCSVGGRSIIMRGERLPPGTRWQGAPVRASP